MCLASPMGLSLRLGTQAGRAVELGWVCSAGSGGAGDGMIWASSALGAPAEGLTAGRLSGGLDEGARGGAETRSPLKPRVRPASLASTLRVTAWPHSPPRQLTSGVFPLPASPLPGLPLRPRGLSPAGPPLRHTPPAQHSASRVDGERRAAWAPPSRKEEGWPPLGWGSPERWF